MTSHNGESLASIVPRQGDGRDPERELANLELERLQRLKDEFLSTVSHELRAPLQSILGWAQALGTEQVSAEELRRGIEIIERNARAQATIIDDLLDVSLMASGAIKLKPRLIDLGRVVQAAIEALRPTAEAKEVELWSAIAERLPKLMADPDRIKQILSNLLLNAIAFSERGGRVTVHLEAQGPFIELRVVDEGKGVEPSFAPFAFHAFTQADGTTTRRRGGLGLGLAIVEHLVELHGGTVRVESEGLGRGATFSIRLPISAALSEPPTGRAPSTLPLRIEHPAHAKRFEGITVLVADDERDARELLAMMLRREGAKTTLVGSVREAIEELSRFPYDVLVSDIAMPGADGYELARWLLGQAHRPRAVLALSAYARPQDRERALAEGFDAYAAKPIDSADLMDTIAKLLAG